MKALLLVALGGGLGSVARWAATGLTLQHTLDWRFPAGTFLVNVLGCAAAGVLAGLSEKFGILSADARLFLFTGILGGFTTFSAFGLETVLLLRRDEWLVAFSNVLLSALCGVFALWLALRAVTT
jgi:CrcB protein